MQTLEGQLLLASPQLLDPNFVQTVVLLIEHNEEGALGVVINRPTSKTIRELWQQVGQSPCNCEGLVHLGGPVSGPIMSLHPHAMLAEMELAPGIYFAAKKQNLDELVHKEADFKLFIGHAGWGPGQLEGEINQGAWQHISASAVDVFDASRDLWQRLINRANQGELPSLLGIKNIPPDPSMN
jgi:putative transcriptional regulator